MRERCIYDRGVGDPEHQFFRTDTGLPAGLGQQPVVRCSVEIEDSVRLVVRIKQIIKGTTVMP